MVFRKIILGTAAASGILMAVSVLAPNSLSVINQAQAETNISINFGFGSFYDGLQPYGNWVSYQDQYVFVPQHIRHGWRPYTLGHWSFTQRYGWLWVSNERFGWATYHYGRWGYARDIGWYWVPGHRWAPAWVAWSRGQNEVAWAPLPPRHGNDDDVNITIGDVPDYYWQAVPTSAFLSINLSNRIISDRNHVRTIVQQSPPETVRIENNIVINTAIQVNDIEKATNKKVPVLVEKPVTNPNAMGKSDGTSVAIFNPDVKVDTTAKPQKAVKVEEIVSARKAQGVKPEDLTANQPAGAAPTLDKNGKPVVPADQPAAKVQAPADTKVQPPADAKAPAPADTKANVDAPVVGKQDKPKVDALKPADAVAPKVDANGKVEVKKSTDTTPVVKAPDAKKPEVKTAPAPAPVVVAPAEKPKVAKPVVAPPVVDTGKPAPDAQIQKKKDAAGSDSKTVAPKVAPPAAVPAAPADGKKATDAMKKNEPGKAKCDPNVETCPPAQ